MNLSFLSKPIVGFNRFLFNVFTRNVCAFPTFNHFDSRSKLAVLSMLRDSDVQMYLVAIYSFLQHITPNCLIIVCDADLSRKSRAMLKSKFSNITLVDAKDFRAPAIPTGGCWERLYAISHYVSDQYVVQLDADTLFVKKPNEVIEAIQENCGFILGTHEKHKRYLLQEMADISQGWIDDGIQHVQTDAEALLPTTDVFGFKYYTRGCAGFAGFPKGSITPELVEKVSIHYTERLDTWHNWGSEQFASNLLLSNVQDVTVLPTETYNSSDKYNGMQIFLHFIGYVRFRSLLYGKLAKISVEQNKLKNQ